MSQRFCSNCGASTQSIGRFCTECGVAFNGSSPAAAENASNKEVDTLKNELSNRDEMIRWKAVKKLDNLNWEPSDDKEKAYYLIAKSGWKELLKLGKPAVQPLIRALTYEWRLQGREVGKVLGQIGDPAAVDALIIALRGEDKRLRATAAKSLGQIRDDRALDPLIAALHDDNYHLVRAEAAWSLGRLRLRKATEPLKEALKEVDSHVRFRAAQSLAEFRWIPSNEEERAYCSVAQHYWSRAERLGMPAIPALTNALRNYEESVEEQAVSALANVGMSIEGPAISILIEDLRDKDDHFRSNIMLALKKSEKKLRPSYQKPREKMMTKM